MTQLFVVSPKANRTFGSRTVRIQLSLIALCCVLALGLGSCESELRVVVPDFTKLDVLENSTPVPASALALIDGVYVVDNGADLFGDTVVLKHDANNLSIFCERNAAYLVLRSGVKNAELRFAGYWRYAQGPQTGLAMLSIDSAQAKLLAKGQRVSSLRLSGSIGSEQSYTDTPLRMHFVRRLHNADAATAGPDLLIIAHRGGGRNSDRLPYSENSAELIAYASKLGAHGVEIDVRLTRDSVPVLYHDENLNTRLVNGEYMVGPIGNYSFHELRELCRLKNGELIPTLKEVLDVVIDSTNLRAVWLDVKDLAEIPVVISLQQAALQRAQILHAAGQRDSLEIFFGLATQEIYDAFVARTDHKEVSSVCELGSDKTLEAGSRVYGARWTLGGLDAELSTLHAEHRRAFVWTLDMPEFIVQFMRDTHYDGFLTNYPTIVAYHYYVQP